MKTLSLAPQASALLKVSLSDPCEVSPMECIKCKGLMVKEQFSDYFLVFYAWKCLNCGCIVDPTISKNQRRPPVPDRVESVSR